MKAGLSDDHMETAVSQDVSVTWVSVQVAAGGAELARCHLVVRR